MNSFSGVRRAAEYEIARQIEVVSKGGEAHQSTRRWDDVTGITEQMRTKEDAHDYRYFPDPDLMPLAPTDEWLANVKSRVVELPLTRKQRFDARLLLPAMRKFSKGNVELGNYFENIAKRAKNPQGGGQLDHQQPARQAHRCQRQREAADQAAMGVDSADVKF